MIRIVLGVLALVILLGVAGESDRRDAEAVAGITAKEYAEIINSGYGRRVAEVEYGTVLYVQAETATAKAKTGNFRVFPLH